MKAKQSVNTIGVIGGGVAGYLTALAFNQYYPESKITLIESNRIPIIGVGEATTPPLVDFLHNILGFDRQEFYREVQPTHKMGIRFEWGFKAPYYFNYPFEPQDIYLAKEINHNPTLSCLQSILMTQGKSFVYKRNGTYGTINSIYEKGNYAYHLDNKKFVNYLKKKAGERGLIHLIDTVKNVELDLHEEKIKHLDLACGKRVKFNLYVDCTGFSSVLLKKSLGVSFVDYSSSLFTDSALTTSISRKADLPAYTTATSMNHGWLWSLPLRDATHIGYVFSSEFASNQEIEQELLSRHPEIKETRLIKFKSGRHENAFKGNVLAIGNAFGFVEPLESTGLHMIVSSLKAFAEIFKLNEYTPSKQERYNQIINDKWDQLRWFLALHYKFNQRLDTPFWQANREKVDVSGYTNLIELMKEEGPLKQEKHMRNQTICEQIQNSIIRFSGLDTFLIGQGLSVKQPNISFIHKNYNKFRAKTALWQEIASQATSHENTLELIESNPHLLNPQLK